VVLDASVAGMCAAGMLAEHFDRFRISSLGEAPAAKSFVAIHPFHGNVPVSFKRTGGLIFPRHRAGLSERKVR
jgi:hypothetical protein